MKGKIVHDVPRPRATDIDWDACAVLAKMTGQPVLCAKDLKNTRIKSVRQYRRPPFVTDEGRIIVEMRNSRVKRDGQRYGDVYLRWAPNTTPTEETK